MNLALATPEMVQAEAAAVETPPQPWTLPQRIGFRFGFTFLLLYILPFPLGTLPLTGRFEEWYGELWKAIVPWAGAHLLQLAQPVATVQNGSGDRTYDYVHLLCLALLAAAAAALWTALDRRTDNRRLAAALRVYVRYWLGAVMISYGAVKTFNTQFPPPPASVLLGTFGDSSPMRLLWTFMGFSPVYSGFAGVLECLGGGLLLFRSTTTLGALISMGVMGNVVMMNFCYDVPVKLFSMLLLGLAVGLAWPDARRVAAFFVQNRLVEPADLGPPRLSPRGRQIWLGAKALLLALILYPIFSNALQTWRTPLPPIAGFYEAEPASGPRAWRTAEFTWYALFVRRADGSRSRFGLGAFDAPRKTLTLRGSFADGTAGRVWVLTATAPRDGDLALDGDLNGEPVHVMLHKTAPPQFALKERGFHWINEYPYNR